MKNILISEKKLKKKMENETIEDMSGVGDTAFPQKSREEYVILVRTFVSLSKNVVHDVSTHVLKHVFIS